MIMAAATSCAGLSLRRAPGGLRLAWRTSAAFTGPAQVRGHRLAPTDDEMYQRTTVSIMQKEAGSDLLIHSYGPRGFTIGGNRVLGPCAVLPPAILQWNVGSYKDISVESLVLFYLLEPRIEVLVLGTGGQVERLDRNVLEFLRKKAIAVEVQDTANACATYNILSNERRVVAAGLIPPPIIEKDLL